MRKLAGLLFLLAVPTTAHALDQGVHRQISVDACKAAGLPKAFCARVGTEVYNVDKYEWNDLAAHAQMDGDVGDNAAACSAANKALERERLIGTDIRKSLAALKKARSKDLAVHIATQLGRALHTIQDNCAHNGMINPQHAWASATDTCTGSKTSPDAQPGAAECAIRETAIVMGSFVTAVDEMRVPDIALDGISSDWAHWPSRGDVCEFLHGASKWKGKDTRWNNEITVPFLQDQLSYALTTGPDSVGDICQPGAAAIARPTHAPNTNVAKAPWCFKLTLFCLGAADAADEAPPWVEDEEAPIADEESAGGCAAGGDSSLGGLLGASVLGLSLVSRTRRRSKR